MKTARMDPPPFKVCPNCRARWERRDSFLSDPQVSLSGYQLFGDETGEGMFLFQHETEACGTSMAIDASLLADLHDDLIRTGRIPASSASLVVDGNRRKEGDSIVPDVLDKVQHWPKHRLLTVSLLA